MMRDPIARYLDKRGRHGGWPLTAGDTAGIEQAIVIPALSEDPGLFDTLADLEANPAEHLARTLVIVVVNNRAVPHASAEDRENNARTLERLEAMRGETPLRLAYIDAASPGRELPRKEGVGLARKLGLDHACALLHANGFDGGALISLDADTRVAPDYLPAIRDHFLAAARPWAAIVNYAHPLDGPAAHRDAILGYELFLRAHELGLRRAASPYAFPAIGSTMVCTPRAYAAVSGMRRKKAAEDFYFLQELAKTGRITRVTETTVHPAARASLRVPFGTGPILEKNEAQMIYHPESYRVLGSFLEEIPGILELDGETIARSVLARACARPLHDFLVQYGFPRAWDNIREHTPDLARRHAQFHRWFDAFRTLKLFHHLRDHGYPDQPLYDALPALLRWAGMKTDLTHADLKARLSVRFGLLDTLREAPACTANVASNPSKLGALEP